MKGDDLRSVVEALTNTNPIRPSYRGDDAFHDECVYCLAEPDAGEKHTPGCLHERARAVLTAAPPPGGWAAGYREGQHGAGRRAGREMGRRLRLKQREERIRAEKADHRLRARLCAEIGVSGALSWDEITRRLRTLHRERFHFEALARDAGRC